MTAAGDRLGPRFAWSRRRFLSLSAAAAGLAGARTGSPALLADVRAKPRITHGVQTGDVAAARAIVWSRTDRPARMIVRYATTPGLAGARVRRTAPAAPEADFTARVDLTDLPPGQRIFYEVRFEAAGGELSDPETGSFATPAMTPAPVRLAWGGDTAGQGWGIDEARGGMRTYEAMRRAEPHLFVHSGDLVYADNPILPTVRLDDGSEWKNVVTEEVAKVAESLREFRGRYQYNLLDAHVRRFNADVPMVAQWDDHEVLNNWYPGERLGTAGADARFTEKSVDVLARRAAQAFLEYTPTRRDPRDPHRIYRRYRYGPLLDLFVLDCRSYRAANSSNLQPRPGPETDMLGAVQIRWLERELAASRAVWKVIACDMPIGLVVPDGPQAQEGFANGNEPVLGREHEIARLLAFLKRRRVRNLIWITADVHHAAAHEYHPARATFTDFDPFWEFVAGPLHAGTFGPNRLDATFGPRTAFNAVPAGLAPNRPPSDGLQFFGLVTIDPATRAAVVTLHDREGREVYRHELAAA